MTPQTPNNADHPGESLGTPSPKPQARERGQGVRPPRTVKQVAFRDKITFAREQRDEPTEVEARLWQLLRDRRHGLKFRRQHPVGDFVLDLYCPAAKLGIELDGPHHQRQARYDQWRTEELESRGIRVLRLPSEEVAADLPGTIARILVSCKERMPSAEEPDMPEPEDKSQPKPPPALPAGDLTPEHRGRRRAFLPPEEDRFAPTPGQALSPERRLGEVLTAPDFPYRFVRRHFLQGVRLDFYCPEARLAVHLDLPRRPRKSQLTEESTQALAKLGIQVLRIPEARLTSHLREVVGAIRQACEERADRKRPPSPQ